MNTLFHTSYETAKGWLHQTLWTYNNVNMTPFGLLRFFFVVFFSLWLARCIFSTINKGAAARTPSKRYAIYRLSRVIYYLLLLIGFLFAASSIGFDFSQLILLLGALGVGIGFGLQNIFNNFFSGIILLFEDQLKLGDLIELEGGVKGEIQEFNFRTTTLLAEENLLIFVPNSLLINNRVSVHRGASK